MAFNQPLEADRVDDLSLFSTLARAPIIGGLLWLLGGDRAREEEARQQEKASIDDHTNDMDQSTSVNQSSLKRSPSSPSSLGWKKGAPSLLGSEISDVGEECAQALSGMNLVLSEPSYGSLHEGTAPKKRLSWSDECGKDLIHYYDGSHPKEPSHQKVEPMRSSMSRSRSVKGKLGSGENRFLPHSLINKRENPAAVMPYGSAEPVDGGAGIESPQWGWYIRTTPPTPDMYHSRQLSRGSQASTATASSDGSAGSQQHYLPVAHPNPVFQNLQERKKPTPVGWPSVPL